VRLSGDDHDGMRATREIPDDVIEAIMRGDAVHGVHAPLATFARRLRALADEPVPAASHDLAALFDGSTPAGQGTVDGIHGGKIPWMAGKVAGLGLVAKLGLGTSLAAASVAGAGAAGVLPTAANDAVRGAIEVISPIDFGPPDGETTTFGRRVSKDATGESDGVTGVDGHDIADDAPGATHRPGSDVADDSPGQAGETGLTQANETPAAPHAPDGLPGTDPSSDRPADPGAVDGNAPADRTGGTEHPRST
jgi:hypothetical protein